MSKRHFLSDFSTAVGHWCAAPLCASTYAQDRAYVLCEGAQDFYSGEVLESPRIGVIDLSAAAPSFEVLRVFEGHSFAVDLALSEDGYIGVCGRRGHCFQAGTLSRVKCSRNSPSMERARCICRETAVYVTRGDVDPATWGSVEFEHYFVALDAQDLSWIAGWAG